MSDQCPVDLFIVARPSPLEFAELVTLSFLEKRLVLAQLTVPSILKLQFNSLTYRKHNVPCYMPHFGFDIGCGW